MASPAFFTYFASAAAIKHRGERCQQYHPRCPSAIISNSHQPDLLRIAMGSRPNTTRAEPMSRLRPEPLLHELEETLKFPSLTPDFPDYNIRTRHRGYSNAIEISSFQGSFDHWSRRIGRCACLGDYRGRVRPLVRLNLQCLLESRCHGGDTRSPVNSHRESKLRVAFSRACAHMQSRCSWLSPIPRLPRPRLTVPG